MKPEYDYCIYNTERSLERCDIEMSNLWEKMFPNGCPYTYESGKLERIRELICETYSELKDLKERLEESEC